MIYLFKKLIILCMTTTTVGLRIVRQAAYRLAEWLIYYPDIFGLASPPAAWTTNNQERVQAGFICPTHPNRTEE